MPTYVRPLNVIVFVQHEYHDFCCPAALNERFKMHRVSSGIRTQAYNRWPEIPYIVWLIQHYLCKAVCLPCVWCLWSELFHAFIFFFWKSLASAGNWTRASRVAGENSTTEPPMLTSFTLSIKRISVKWFNFMGTTFILFGYWFHIQGTSLHQSNEKHVTPTWFEHTTFWSGVRRATVAPRSPAIIVNNQQNTYQHVSGHMKLTTVSRW